MTTTYYSQNVEIEVEYDYSPAEEVVYYYPDGSGHPGTPAMAEVINLWIGGEEVMDLILVNAPRLIEEIEQWLVVSEPWK